MNTHWWHRHRLWIDLFFAAVPSAVFAYIAVKYFLFRP